MRLAYWLGRLNTLLCRIFGHKKPYKRTIRATFCSRCQTVIKLHDPYYRLTILKERRGKIRRR